MTSQAQNNLVAIAQTCQAQAVKIPESPLYHMGKMGLGIGGEEGRKKSASILQDTIDYLTCKAKAKLSFNKDEKEFLIELYKAFAWGAAMKAYIKDLDTNRLPFHILKTNNPSFRRSAHFRPLMKINNSRNDHTQGYVLSNGAVHAEQNNRRLKNADNRFIIQAMTRKTQHGFTTVWSVDNDYDFEPFGAPIEKVTEIPLNPPLKLPDGLSEYMHSGLNIAKPFKYKAQWTEFW